MLQTLALLIAVNTPSDLTTKLAEAIANEGAGIGVRLYVGTFPSSRKPEIPLPVATLLGTTERDPNTNLDGFVPTDTYFYEAAGSADDVESSYRRELLRDGWIHASPERVQTRLFKPEGFNVEQMPSPLRQTYCNADRTASIEEHRLESLPEILVISYTQGIDAGGTCAMMAMMNSTAHSTPLLPAINAPPNVTMTTPQVRFFMTMRTSEASITGNVSIATLAYGFSKQIMAAGWTSDAPAQSPTAYAQTFHMMNGEGRYELVLTIVDLGNPGAYYARLSLSKNDAAPSP
jgi:hypothetical protein